MNAPALRTSVIICTKDRRDDLAAALRSLAAQSQRPDDVLVVNAGREPAVSDELLNELGPAFPLRCLDTEPGLTRQRNLGIRAASGDVLFFFDDDVVLEPEYLRHAVAVFAGDVSGRIGAVSGRILFPAPGRMTRGDAVRALVRRLFLLDSMGDGRLKASGFAAYPHLRDERGAVECLSGCCMAFRREVFSHVQFDEALAGYSFMEDTDIAESVREQGYSLYYEPAARLVHNVSVRGRDSRELTSRMLVRNYAYLFRKHWNTGFRRRLAFRWALLGLLVSALVDRDRRRVRGMLQGWRELGRGPIGQEPGRSDSSA